MSKPYAAYGEKMHPVTGPAVWDRAEIADDAGWRYQLTPDTLSELRANIARLDPAIVVLKDVTPDNFPLPSFVEQGRAIARQLGFGRGIASLAGLDVASYTLPQLKLIYTGLSAHIGITVSQSHRGDYIGEVMDFRNKADDRRYHNGGEFVMHRDPTADVSGLLSIRRSMTGGYSRLLSAGMLHNVLLSERPELMETFYRGFYFRRTTPDRGNSELYTPHRIPSFDFSPTGEFMAHYIPHFSEYYQERDGLRSDHVEVRAQAAIKEVMWDRPELYLEYMMELGDMQFVSNRVALHSRTDYVDWPEIERARLLVRVWMQLPELPPVPTHMQYFENRDRADGGIAKLGV
jgi:hypothetical protein